MVKARTVYIWNGPDAITITRGYGLQKEEHRADAYRTKIKHKGLFKSFFPVTGINEQYIGNSKRLIIDDKPQDGWEVIVINKDYLTHEPNVPDIPPNIVTLATSLRNELEMWKKKYFDAIRLNQDREQKDRFRSRVKSEAEFMANVKNKFYSSGFDSGLGGFARSFGLPPMQPPSGGSSEE